MVEISIVYEGDLRCTATHGPSGARLSTDAPVDNHGRGESFSPTDLVATALASCVLTILGIAAAKHGWDLRGARARVVKGMASEPRRRIASLALEVDLPAELDERARAVLERAARSCPVHASLGAEVELPMVFRYGTEG